MKLHEIRDILKADVLTGEEQLSKTVMAGGGADLMDDILSAVAESAALLTGLTTEKVLRTAKIAGVTVIVFVRGKKPETKCWNLPGPMGYP